MGDQQLATYFFKGLSVRATQVDIYGCWSSETPEGTFEFYDLYDADSGDCLNEGEPLYTFPTWQEVLSRVQEQNDSAAVVAAMAGA